MLNLGPNQFDTVHPLLRGLPRELLIELERCSIWSQFEDGEYVCRAGKPATRIHLLQFGRVVLEVELEASERSEVGILGAGDLLGCPSLSEYQCWPLSARSAGHVVAQSIVAERLEKLLKSFPDFGCEFARRVADRIHNQLSEARNVIARMSRIALDSQVMALELFIANSGNK